MGLERNPPRVPGPRRAAGSSGARPWMRDVGGVLGTEVAELRRGLRGAAAGLRHPRPAQGTGLWGGISREVAGGGGGSPMSRPCVHIDVKGLCSSQSTVHTAG